MAQHVQGSLSQLQTHCGERRSLASARTLLEVLQSSGQVVGKVEQLLADLAAAERDGAGLEARVASMQRIA